MKTQTFLIIALFFCISFNSLAFRIKPCDEEFRKVTLTKETTNYLYTDFNADSTTYTSIEVHKVAGVPRWGIVKTIENREVVTIDSISYLENTINRDLYNPCSAPSFQDNVIKVFSKDDFRFIMLNAKSGAVEIDDVFSGQPDKYHDTTYVIGRDLAPIDSSITSKEFWGITEITPGEQVPTPDNHGTIVDYNHLTGKIYFLIMVNETTGFIFYVRTIEKED